MIAKIFISIGFVILFVNTILFLKSFSKQGKPFKILAIYSMSMFCIQMTAKYLSEHQINNLFLSHFYFIIQFLLLSLFFYNLFKEKTQKLIVKLLLVICFITLIVQYSLNYELVYKYNELEVILTSIPLILYCTMHLYNLLSQKKEFYFFTIGFLIYLFGSTIIFLTGNLVLSMKSRYFSDKIFDLNVYLYVVYQSFIAYELIKMFFCKKNLKN